MPVIELSRQQRVDGGLRTSIFVDGERLFHLLENANLDEPDPTLEWFIDLKFAGGELPTDNELLREWLRENSSIPIRMLEGEASGLEIGMDESAWPRQVVHREDDWEVQLIYSAMRRIPARKMGVHLQELAANWTSVIENLSLTHPVEI